MSSYFMIFLVCEALFNIFCILHNYCRTEESIIQVQLMRVWHMFMSTVRNQKCCKYFFKCSFSNLERQFIEVFQNFFHDSNLFMGAKHFYDDVRCLENISGQF